MRMRLELNNQKYRIIKIWFFRILMMTMEENERPIRNSKKKKQYQT